MNNLQCRTLPLVPFMRERLLTLKEEQQENHRLCGRSYIKDYLEYVCVNEIGDLIKPHYVTESFPKLLKAKGMRQIRYHDLRHPYVKHTTKNKSLQKQKSQTINADSLGFLFFEDVAFVLVRFNFSLLEKNVEIASAHLFESF